MHQPFDGEIHLWPAKATDETAGDLVRHNQPVGHIEVLDFVGTAERTVHPVKRSRHRRAQIGTIIIKLIDPHADHFAVILYSGFNRYNAVRRRRGRR